MNRLVFLAALAGSLAACGSPDPATTHATPAASPAGPAAIASTDSPPADSVDAPVGTVTFTIDGQAEAGVSGGVSKLSSTTFTLAFGSEQLEVSAINHGKQPLAVGRFPILDWDHPGVQVIAGRLPARFNGEGQGGRGTYSSFMGIEESNRSNPFHVYDWGAGVQPLRGREVGQVVFTRLSDGTADGTFQCAIYIESGPVKSVAYQGQSRVLHPEKEHLLKGTFKGITVFDAGSVLRGGK